MLRLITTLVLGIALGYCMFFVRLEGRSLASHMGDIWRSSVVQQKVKLVEREVPRALRGTVPAQAPSPRQQRAHGHAAQQPEADAPPASWEQDRQQLDNLVHRAHQGRKAAAPARP